MHKNKWKYGVVISTPLGRISMIPEDGTTLCQRRCRRILRRVAPTRAKKVELDALLRFYGEPLPDYLRRVSR